MDIVNIMFNFFENLINGFTDISSWLFSSIGIEFMGLGVEFTPILLISVGGLIGYLAIAVGKWIIA